MEGEIVNMYMLDSCIVFQSRHYYAMIINVLLTIDFSMSTEVSSKLGRS